MKALKKFLKNRTNVVFLDFEGTQFSHEIIAIGAIKCTIDENLKIIKEDDEGFISYVKATNPIGKIISKMTNLSEEFIQQNGISFEDALNKFQTYVGDIENTTFIVFGSNDARMIIESIKYSHPNNENIAYAIIERIFDYLSFLSQYVKDGNNNTLSLVHYVELFNGIPSKVSHNPLNDSRDLKNLYSLFLENKAIIKNEYKKILAKQKIYPEPVRKVILKLENNEIVTPDEFETLIDKYLA